MNRTLEPSAGKLPLSTVGDKLLQLLCLVAVALCLLAMLPERLHAAQVLISCSDVNDADSCQLSADSTFTEGTYEVVQNLLQVTQSNSASGVCVQTQANTYSCDISGNPAVAVPLTCTVQGNSANCQYPGRPELLSVNCEQTGQAGQCVLTSDPASLDGTLSQSGHGNLVSFSSILLSGCASLSGNNQFREDCAFLLDGFSNNEAAVINTSRAVAPLNADTPIYSSLNFVDSSMGHLRRRLGFLRQIKRYRGGVAPAGLRSEIPSIAGYDYIERRSFARTNPEFPLLSAGSSLVETPLTDAAGFSRLGVFLDTSVLSSEVGSQSEENGSGQAGGIITWGVDYRYSADFTAGMAFSTSSTSIDYSAGRGDLSDLGFQLLAFGSYYNGNIYVDGSLGVGGNQYEQSRVLRCAASDGCAFQFDQRADSRFSGRLFSYSLAAGYDLTLLQSLTITPFAQLTGSTITVDAYRESVSNPDQAGAGFAVELDEQTRTTTLISAGVRGSYPFSSGSVVSVPYASFELVSAPNDDELTISGMFAGNQNQGEQFEVTNRAVENSYAVMALGSVFQFQRGWSAFVSGNVVFGNSRTDKFQLTSGLRWEL